MGKDNSGKDPVLQYRLVLVARRLNQPFLASTYQVLTSIAKMSYLMKEQLEDNENLSPAIASRKEGQGTERS